MQRLEDSSAVRPLQWQLGVKGLRPRCIGAERPRTQMQSIKPQQIIIAFFTPPYICFTKRLIFHDNNYVYQYAPPFISLLVYAFNVYRPILFIFDKLFFTLTNVFNFTPCSLFIQRDLKVMRCFQSSVPPCTRLHVIFSRPVCGQEETSDFLEQTNLFEHTVLNILAPDFFF